MIKGCHYFKDGVLKKKNHLVEFESGKNFMCNAIMWPYRSCTW